jgi:3-hydroxybutyryl-CoA dehydrogenase/5-formyl-3-hydroxy-2-methylpyridine 4-carboxylate dehydrogenase
MAVKRAAVIGTGTMGPGMGAVLARAGIETALYDVSEEQLEKAKAGAELAHGVLERLDAAHEPGGSLRFESDLATALEGVDFVLEAVPERLELKHEVFPQFEAHVADDAILASNTSGIPITKIAQVCKHPERVVGMHWSNPPHLIPMIEVIPGEKTSQATVDATNELVRRVGYHPVVEKEIAGFVENRILYAILRECLDLVDKGIVGGTQNAIQASLNWKPTDYVLFGVNFAHLMYDDAAIATTSGDRDYNVNVLGVRGQIDF